MCRLVQECAAKRSDAAYMAENIVMHSRVRSDAKVQSERLGAEFQTINVQSLGHPHHRVRRIATNIVSDLRQLEQKKMMDVNTMLEPMGLCTGAQIPCVMAAEPDTHNPVKLWDVKTSEAVGAAPVEVLEVLQGYSVGVSCAFGAVDVPMALRRKMVENEFHSAFLQSIIREWRPWELHERRSSIMAFQKEQMDLEGYETPLEKELKHMSDEQMEAWIAARLVGYECPMLKLQVKEGFEASGQFPPRSRYQSDTAAAACADHGGAA